MHAFEGRDERNTAIMIWNSVLDEVCSRNAAEASCC